MLPLPNGPFVTKKLEAEAGLEWQAVGTSSLTHSCRELCLENAQSDNRHYFSRRLDGRDGSRPTTMRIALYVLGVSNGW